MKNDNSNIERNSSLQETQNPAVKNTAGTTLPLELLNHGSFKRSLFNFRLKKNGKILLYNSLKGTFLEIGTANSSLYKWLGDESVTISHTNGFKKNWRKIGNEAKKNLLLGGYVIPEDFDEMAYLSFRNKSERFRKDYYSMTVVLTHACNMNCVYCYENAPGKKIYMTEKIAKQLILFIETILKDKPKYFDVTWYGGEPLLQYNLILKLSKKIIALCRKYDVKYSASIITNGTLLTRKKAKALKKMHVKSAQITSNHLGWNEDHT